MYSCLTSLLSGLSIDHVYVKLFQEFGLGLPGWQIDRVGQLQHEQSPCHTFAVIMGHDLCLCPFGQFCRLRGSRQHLLHLQVNIYFSQKFIKTLLIVSKSQKQIQSY